MSTTPRSALLHLLAPVRGRLALAALLQSVAGIASVAALAVIAHAGAVLLRQGPAPSLLTQVLAAGLLLLVRAAGLGLATTVSHLADNDLQLDLRRRLVAKLGRLPMSWFDATSSARVKRAVADDVGALHHLSAHALLDIAAAVTVPVAGLVWLLLQAPLLTLIAVLPLVLTVIGHQLLGARLRPRMEQYATAMGALDSAAVEFIRGIQVIKVFGHDRPGGARARFGEAANGYGTFVHRWARDVTPAMAALQTLGSAPVILITALTAGVALGEPVAGVLAVALIAPTLGAPILSLGFALQDLGNSVAAAHRIADLLDTEEAPAVRELPWPTPTPRVELREVSLRLGETQVLDRISGVFEPGTTTAICGPSGSGKTTLVEVISGLRRPDSGQVLIEGVDLHQMTPATIGAHLGVVSQEAPVLRASARDNVALGAPGIGTEGLNRAAATAQILDRITELPRGWDTVLGDETTLSGGERQRLALARALAGEPAVLVLDEPTSFADLASEHRLDLALDAEAGRRTVIRVDHRLASTRRADRVWVLEDGRLTESGSPDELLARDGAFARLVAAHHQTEEGLR